MRLPTKEELAAQDYGFGQESEECTRTGKCPHSEEMKELSHRVIETSVFHGAVSPAAFSCEPHIALYLYTTGYYFGMKMANTLAESRALENLVNPATKKETKRASRTRKS